MNFKDLKYELKWLFRKYIKYPYSNVKWYFKNQIHFHKIVSKMRPWDYSYVLDMLYFTLNDLGTYLEFKGIEVDENRLPRVKQIKRCVELIKNIQADEYMERVGYDYEFNKGLKNKGQKQDYKEFYEKALELENNESEELFSILKNNIKGWWD